MGSILVFLHVLFLKTSTGPGVCCRARRACSKNSTGRTPNIWSETTHASPYLPDGRNGPFTAVTVNTEGGMRTFSSLPLSSALARQWFLIGLIRRRRRITWRNVCGRRRRRRRSRASKIKKKIKKKMANQEECGPGWPVSTDKWRLVRSRFPTFIIPPSVFHWIFFDFFILSFFTHARAWYRISHS